MSLLLAPGDPVTEMTFVSPAHDSGLDWGDKKYSVQDPDKILQNLRDDSRVSDMVMEDCDATISFQYTDEHKSGRMCIYFTVTNNEEYYAVMFSMSRCFSESNIVEFILDITEETLELCTLDDKEIKETSVHFDEEGVDEDPDRISAGAGIGAGAGEDTSFVK